MPITTVYITVSVRSSSVTTESFKLIQMIFSITNFFSE